MTSRASSEALTMNPLNWGVRVSNLYKRIRSYLINSKAFIRRYWLVSRLGISVLRTKFMYDFGALAESTQPLKQKVRVRNILRP